MAATQIPGLGRSAGLNIGRDLINQRGGFNRAARGGAASGVKYFSDNVVPGLPDLPAEVPRQPSLQESGGGEYAGGDGGRPERDLEKDPLTDEELDALSFAQKGLGAMFGPFGGIMSAAIDYNLGNLGYVPNINEKKGSETSLFANTYSAGRANAAFPSLTLTELMQQALGTSKAGQFFGVEAPVTIDPKTGAASYTYSDNTGWKNPVTVSPVGNLGNVAEEDLGTLPSYAPIAADYNLDSGGNATLGIGSGTNVGLSLTGGSVGLSAPTDSLAPSLGPAQGGTTAIDTSGTLGYTPSQVAEMQAQDQQYSMGPPASAAPAADSYSGSSDFGAGYDAGAGMSSAESDSRGAGGDYGWADGGLIGPVGLSISGYAEGGAVQGPLLAMGFADGGPMPSMGAVGNTPSPDMINMQVNQMARNPQFQQRVAQAIQPLMQSGELTPQEVQVMGQIAEASLQNPKLYPQLRQFVAQQGMSPLPPSFDPSVIVKILAITRALQGGGAGAPQPGQGQPTPPGRVPPTNQAQMQNPAGMANGGFLVGPGTGRSDSIGTVNESSGQPVKVANGEYVIPKHVVDAKGREFFDNLLRRYSELPKAEG